MGTLKEVDKSLNEMKQLQEEIQVLKETNAKAWSQVATLWDLLNKERLELSTIREMLNNSKDKVTTCSKDYTLDEFIFE